MKTGIKAVVFFAFLLAVFSPSYAMGQFQFMQDSMEGKTSPEFTLKTAQGESMSLSQARGDNAAIIFFWATWCPHCRKQLHEMNQQAQDLQQKGIKVILVDVGENAQTVQAYINKNEIKFDAFLDENNEVSDKYAIVGVPTLYFVNKKGIINDVEHAFPENYEAILAQ